MSESGAGYGTVPGTYGGGEGSHQQWGQATYSGAGYPPPGYPRQRQTSGRAIAVLVLGIASLTVFWGVAGIVALCLSPGAKREIAASQGHLGGEDLVKAGVICSWISIALTILTIIAFVGLFTVFAAHGQTLDIQPEVVNLRTS